jgi:hypothetical protein
VKPIVGTEVRRLERESQTERIVCHGQERREDRVGPLGETIEASSTSGQLQVPDLLKGGRRGPPVGPSPCDGVEKFQA